MGSSVKNLKITKETGTDRTYIATWDFSPSHVDHFDVSWQYQSGNGFWIADNISSSKPIPGARRQSSFTAPDNAIKIRVAIKGVSTQHTVNKKQEYYWKEDYCKFKELNINGVIVYKPAKIGFSGFAASDFPINLHPVNAGSVYISFNPKNGSSDSEKLIGMDIIMSTEAASVVESMNIDDLIEFDFNDAYDGYEYEWQYRRGSSVWFPDSNGNVSGSSIATYSYPDTTTEVRVRVKPVSKEFTSQLNGNTYAFFTSGFSPWISTKIKDAKPVVPTRNPYDCVNHTNKPASNKILLTLDVGSSTSIRATWKDYDTKVGDSTDHVAKYDYLWQFYDPTIGAKGQWLEGGSGTTSGSSVAYRTFAFTPPSRSTHVRVKVKPIAKTYTKAGQQWAYWKTGWGDSKNWFQVKLSDFNAKIPASNPVKIPIGSIKINKLKGQSNTVFAAWTWNVSNTDHYEFKWEYSPGDGIWFEETEGQTTGNIKNTTYGIPTGAAYVRFCITPIATTYTDIHERELSRWKANASDWVEYKIQDPMSGVPTAPKIAKLDISAEQVPGSPGSIYAVCKWQPIINKTGLSVADMHVDSIKYTWSYQVSNGQWFDNSEETSSQYENFEIVIPPHTIENTAKKVRIKIMPVSQEYTDAYTDTLPYWKSSYSEWFEFDLAMLDPPAPSNAPSISIDKTVLTAVIDNYNTEAADSVEFEIVQDYSKVIATGSSVTALLLLGHAELKYTIALGHTYTARARGVKGAKHSEWTEYSSAVNTGPTTPDRIESCQAQPGNMVKLTWTYVANAETYEIEYAERLEWFDVSSEVKSEETEDNVSMRIITPGDEGRTWYFRVRAKNSDGESGWTEPVSCILAKTPQPPTTWSDSTVISLGETATMFWVHNAEDGSNEREATIRYFLSSDPETEHLEVITDDPSDEDVSDQIHSFEFDTSSFAAGQDILWSVKTLGAAEDYSDYSTERKISVYESATVAFSVPEEMLSYPLSFTANAAPSAQTAVTYNVRINANESYETSDHAGNPVYVMAGQEVYSRFFDVAENELEVSIMPQDVTLENNISYTITVTVAMDSGLVAVASNDFTTALYSIEMNEPDAEVILNEENFSASIRPYLLDSEDEIASDVTLGVYRRNFDGTFTQIGIDIPNTGNITLIDPHPALDFARYRITAKSEITGITTFKDLTGYPFSDAAGMVIQWGDEWAQLDEGETIIEQPTFKGNLVHLPYNVNTTDSHDPDVAMIEYIGRSNPVSYFGTQLGVTSTWDTEIDAKDYETLYALRRLSIYQGNAYVRESSGMGYWAHVKVSISKTHREVTIPVSFDITKVEGGI